MTAQLMRNADHNRAMGIVNTHKVLRNTYALLSATLLFSAITASISVAFNLPHPGLMMTLLGYFGLLFAITKFRHS